MQLQYQLEEEGSHTKFNLDLFHSLPINGKLGHHYSLIALCSLDCTLFTWCTEWIWSRMLASLCAGLLNTLLQRNYHCSTSAGWCSFAILSKNRGGVWKLIYSKLHRTSSSNTDSLILGKYIGVQMNGKQAVIKPILVFLTCYSLMESRAVWCTYCVRTESPYWSTMCS